jgi:hypothetical protein
VGEGLFVFSSFYFRVLPGLDVPGPILMYCRPADPAGLKFFSPFSGPPATSRSEPVDYDPFPLRLPSPACA